MNTQPKPTTERLAEALIELSAPQEMIDKARAGYYDDYKSPVAFPQIELAQDAKQAGLGPDFHKRIVNGEFDAQKWEAKAWAKSPDGQATFAEFFQQVEQKHNRAQRRHKK